MKHYLLFVWGDVEPEIRGPYKNRTTRFEAARRLRKKHGDNHGVYTLDAAGKVEVGTYAGGTLE